MENEKEQILFFIRLNKYFFDRGDEKLFISLIYPDVV